MKKMIVAVLLSAVISAPAFADTKQITRTKPTQFKSEIMHFQFKEDYREISFENWTNENWSIHLFVNQYTPNGDKADKVTFICNGEQLTVNPGSEWATCNININSTSTIKINHSDFKYGADFVVQTD